MAPRSRNATMPPQPMANPDGYEFSWSASGSRTWRKNRAPNNDQYKTFGVDLNVRLEFCFANHERR